MPYNEEYVDATWETCSLRKWLNDEFWGTFSGQEQSRILPMTNINEDNQWFGTKGGNKTTDRIFLLSLSEVVRYFGDSGRLAERLESDRWHINDIYNKERMSNYNNSATWWWLRSPGFNFEYAPVSVLTVLCMSVAMISSTSVVTAVFVPLCG